MIVEVEQETERKLSVRWVKEGAIDAALSTPFAGISLITFVFSVACAVIGGPLGAPFSIPSAAACAASSLKIYNIWEKHNLTLQYVPELIRTLRHKYTFNQDFKNVSFEEAEQVAEWVFNTAWNMHQDQKISFPSAHESAIRYYEELVFLRGKYKITHRHAEIAFREISSICSGYLKANPASKTDEARNYAEHHYFKIMR